MARFAAGDVCGEVGLFGDKSGVAQVAEHADHHQIADRETALEPCPCRQGSRRRA